MPKPPIINEIFRLAHHDAVWELDKVLSRRVREIKIGDRFDEVIENWLDSWIERYSIEFRSKVKEIIQRNSDNPSENLGN